MKTIKMLVSRIARMGRIVTHHGVPGLIFLTLVMGVETPMMYGQWVPANGTFNSDIWCFASSGSNLFAGTWGSGVFRSTDDGTSWTPVNTGLTNLNVHALVVSGGNIFAGTLGGGVYRSTNNGASWTATNTGLSYEKIYSLAVMGQNLFAGAVSASPYLASSVFLSTDDGASWSAVNAGLPNTNELTLTVSGSDLLLGAPGWGVFLSTDNGTTWSSINTGLTNNSIGSIAVSETNLFAGTGGGVFLSTDTGASWTVVNDGLSDQHVRTLTVSGTNLFAGTFGGVFLSTNDGTSWTAVTTGLTEPDVLSLAVSGATLFAGTRHGGLFQTTNNGTSWTTLKTGLTGSWVRYLVASGTDLFAGTVDRGVFLSTDNGRNWTGVNDGLTDIHVSCLAVTGTNLFVGTYDGVFRSTNSGTSWSSANAGLTGNYAQCFAVSGTNIFAGTGGGVFLSTDNGTTWSAVNAGLTNPFIQSLAISGIHIYAGTIGGVFHSTDNGTSWSEVNTGLTNPFIQSLVVSDDNLFAGTYGGGVFLSTNDGTNWTAVNAGLTETYVISLVISGPDLFAGTSYGQVFHSSDNGSSWNAVDSGLTNIESISSIVVSGPTLCIGTYTGVWQRPLLEMVMFRNHPILMSVSDVPYDQGGKVSLFWSATHLDTNVTTLPYYSVWRSIPQLPAGMTNSREPRALTTDFRNASYRTTIIDGTEYAWEWIGNQPAHRFGEYSFTAPTLFDSVEGNDGIHYFLVSAQTDNPNVFYDSNIKSGYSVDNLAPTMPTGLVATVDPGPVVVLTWDSPVDTDLYHFRVYRSALNGFDPAPGNFIGSSTTTGYTDGNPMTGSRAYYRLVAVDVHENASPPSDQAVAGVTITRSVEVQAKWNIISIPLSVTNSDMAALFPMATTSAYSYNGEYKLETTLEQGRGYMVKFLSTESIPIEGFDEMGDTIDVIPGWNLVGAPRQSTSVSNITSIPGGIITSYFYGYDSKYHTCSTLYPGKGYWVKVSDAGQLIMSNNGSLTPANQIRIEDSGENPPPPPDQITTAVPDEFALDQNFPNPFNPLTILRYQLPVESVVTLKIFNHLGQEVNTLVDESQAPGYRSVEWRSTDASGHSVSTGVYYYKLEAVALTVPNQSFTQVKKMLLIK